MTTAPGKRAAGVLVLVLLGACGAPAAVLLPIDCPGMSHCCDPTSSQVIYAHSDSQLFTIDPSNWNASLIGSFYLSGSLDAGPSMTDLAVSPLDEVYTISYSDLYRVDRSTAAVTLVMSLLADMTNGGFNGLTSLPDGTLLAVDFIGDIVALDPIAKTLTPLGSYGSGFTSSGDLVSVADGTLYGISYTSAGGVDASSNNILLKVDPRTAVATAIGPIGYGNVYGLGYYGGTLLAFTEGQQIIRLDPNTGAGTIVSYSPVQFWGAGVSPLISGTCP
jgi:hypothetical protein